MCAGMYANWTIIFSQHDDQDHTNRKDCKIMAGTAHSRKTLWNFRGRRAMEYERMCLCMQSPVCVCVCVGGGGALLMCVNACVWGGGGGFRNPHQASRVPQGQVCSMGARFICRPVAVGPQQNRALHLSPRLWREPSVRSPLVPSVPTCPCPAAAAAVAICPLRLGACPEFWALVQSLRAKLPVCRLCVCMCACVRAGHH